MQQENQIPYELLGHLILVKGKINNSQDQYNFIVDTGGLTFIDKTIAQNLKLKQKGNMAKIDILEIPDIQIKNIFCFTTFDFSLFKSLGIPLHGMIGSDLLDRYRVTFDFKIRIITLSLDHSPLKPDENDLFFKFKNHPYNNAPMIKFKTDQKILEGMIDTGQPYNVVFPLATFDEYKDVEGIDFIKSKGLIEWWPMTKPEFNYLTRMKSMDFDKLRTQDLICLFAELPRPLSVPLIGMDLLSQFKVTINYPNDEMILVPYKDQNFKKNLYSIGINPEVSDQNKIVIKGIWTDSPADLAGLHVGDIIFAFNSESAASENIMKLRSLLEDDEIKAITLEIIAQNKSRKITLEKEYLF